MGRSGILRQSAYAFELLLERRIWLFAIADFIVILQGLLTALLGTGRLEQIYTSMVLVPIVLLGVPVLSSSIALERRAGSLDLALASASTERYFLRRTLPVCLFLVVQAWSLLAVAYGVVHEHLIFDYLRHKGHLVVPVVLHCALVGIMTGAVTLFWASRISSAGGTMVASFATMAILGKWVFLSPFVEGFGPSGTWILGVLPPILLHLVWNLGVLALTTVLFYLYARERLRRPELMLA